MSPTLSTEQALMRLALDVLRLLDSAGDDEVNADTAVTWMESMAGVLRDLPEDGRRRLAGESRALAAEARAQGRVGAADFYESAPNDIGFMPSEG